MNLVEAASWAEEMDVRVTVCDLKGIVVYMNQAAILGLHKRGGADLIGRSLFDCHNTESKRKIQEMLEHPEVNIYLIEKDNEKRVIRQFPWMEGGEHKGVIEFSFPIPEHLFNR